MLALLVAPAPLAQAGLSSIGPLDSLIATGNSGLVTSMNGIATSDLILGTTTFPNTPLHPEFPPGNADNFDLSLLGSADEQPSFDTRFAQGVTTIFLIENNGNDAGIIQGLDADGNPVGSSIPFATSQYFKSIYKTANNQTAAGLAVQTDSPVFGVRVTPPSGAVLGFDPISVSGVAVIPEPGTAVLLVLGALAWTMHRRAFRSNR